MNSNKKGIFHMTPGGKAGGFIVIFVAIALVILIFANLLFSLIPNDIVVWDTSSMNLLAISDNSKKFLKNIDEDVTLYYLCRGGEKNTHMGAFLDRVAALNKHIKVEVVDTDDKPTFSTQYTNAVLGNGSVIVKSGKRATAIDVNAFSYWSCPFPGLDKMTYEEFSNYQYDTTYLAMFNELGVTEYFNGDQVLTGAIEYVLLEKVPTVYYITNHGEAARTDVIKDYTDAFFGETLQHAELKLSDEGDIPSNATCIVISDPKTDITESEKAKIEKYLKSGGNIYLTTDPKNVDALPNLLSILSAYGVSTSSSVVYENDNKPTFSAVGDKEHLATEYWAKKDINVYFSNSGAITVAPGDNSITATSIFTTSNEAYLEGSPDKAGKHTLGVAVSKKTEDYESKIVWFASAETFTDKVAKTVNYTNYYYYLSSLDWMVETFEADVAKDVEGIRMTDQPLDVPNAFAVTFLIISVVVIPASIAITGIVYLYIRRKR